MTSEDRRRKRLKKLVDILYIDSYAERIQETVCENEHIPPEKIEEMIGEHEKTIRIALEEGEELPLSPPGGYTYRDSS